MMPSKFLEDSSGNKSSTRAIMFLYGWSGIIMSWVAFFMMIFYFKDASLTLQTLIAIMAVTVGHGIIKLGDRNRSNDNRQDEEEEDPNATV